MADLPYSPDGFPLISNLADPLLPPRLPDDVTAGWMTPPTNHGGWADSQWNSDNTDFWSLPIGASPGDILAGYDELGNPIYQTITGQRYQLNAAPQKQGSVVRALAETAMNQPVTDSIGAVAKALAQGAWDTFSLPGRAAAGEPVTYGDVRDFVGDYGVMGALTAAPEGALRAGPMRFEDAPPRNLRERYAPELKAASGYKDPQRIKLTPERMEVAKQNLLGNTEFARDAFGLTPEEAIARRRAGNMFGGLVDNPSPYRATAQSEDAIAFTEAARRAGFDARLKHADGPQGSVYVKTGDGRTVRFSDHSQPMEAGKVVGGFSPTLGRRHYPADFSVDPYSGMTAEDVMRILTGDQAGGIPATPGTTQADEIMGLLSSGRGADVTDEMMALADQDYLSSIYDLPMDEASRMARAVDQGYDYVRRSQSIDDPFNDVPWAMFAEHGGDPVLSLERLSSYGPGQWLGKPALEGREAGKALVRAARGSQVDRLEGVTGAEIARRAMPERIVDGAGLWDDMTPARWMSEELATSGVDSIRTPDGMVAFMADGAEFPPTGIRSFSARFDPRLSHLRNLSAGLGGLGLGIYAMQPTEADAAELQAYLESLP